MDNVDTTAPIESPPTPTVDNAASALDVNSATKILEALAATLVSIIAMLYLQGWSYAVGYFRSMHLAWVVGDLGPGALLGFAATPMLVELGALTLGVSLYFIFRRGYRSTAIVLCAISAICFLTLRFTRYPSDVYYEPSSIIALLTAGFVGLIFWNPNDFIQQRLFVGALTLLVLAVCVLLFPMMLGTADGIAAVKDPHGLRPVPDEDGQDWRLLHVADHLAYVGRRLDLGDGIILIGAVKAIPMSDLAKHTTVWLSTDRPSPLEAASPKRDASAPMDSTPPPSTGTSPQAAASTVSGESAPENSAEPAAAKDAAP